MNTDKILKAFRNIFGKKEKSTKELLDTITDYQTKIENGTLFLYEMKLSNIGWKQCSKCGNGGKKAEWIIMESGKVMCVKCGEMN